MKRALIGLLLATLSGCGSYGEPLPPIDKTPPPFPEARVVQRGSELLLQFGTLPEVVNVNGAMVTLRDVEILVLAERYPAITPDVLALALDEERTIRMRDARQAAAAARAEVERRREAAAAAAAAAATGEETEEGVEEDGAEDPEAAAPEDQTDTDEEEERTLTPDELAIRRVPRAVQAEWRAAEVAPDALLDAAYRLQRAVDALWDELDMPAAIVDLREPPRLPDPGRVILGAGRVQRTLTYETAPDLEIFLREAETVATIPFDELENYRTGDQLEYAYAIPAPTVANVRTRYIFAVRAVSEEGDEGRVGNLLPLAPALVPAAPTELETEILPTGVRLQWKAPTIDIAGNPLDPAEVRYNVYRRELPEALLGRTPRNPLPLTETEWIDTDTDWQERYFYEVRAAIATLADLAREEASETVYEPVTLDAVEATAAREVRKESAALASAEIFTEDIFPPTKITGLLAVRAGSRVTLRWNASGASDLAGYRVYRHPAPAPETEDLEILNLPTQTAVPAVPGAAVAEAEAEATAASEEGVDAAATEGQAGETAATEEPEEETASAEELVEAAGEAAEALAEESLTPEQEAAAARDRRRARRRNALVEAGWELLTAVVTTQARYLDPSSDPGVTWIYVVEAVDGSQNVSTPVGVILEAEEQP